MLFGVQTLFFEIFGPAASGIEDSYAPMSTRGMPISIFYKGLMIWLAEMN